MMKRATIDSLLDGMRKTHPYPSRYWEKNLLAEAIDVIDKPSRCEHYQILTEQVDHD